MFRTLVNTQEIELAGQVYSVGYYEQQTLRGTRRYSAEFVVGPADRIIVDAGSLTDLELKVTRLAPATIYSRMLAAGPAA